MKKKELLKDCKARKNNGIDFLMFEAEYYGFRSYMPFSMIVADWASTGKLGRCDGYHSGQLYSTDGYAFFYLAWSSKGHAQFLKHVSTLGSVIVVQKKDEE